MNCAKIVLITCTALSLLGVGEYVAAVKKSADRQFVLAGPDITDGSAALACEKADCLKHNIPVTEVLPEAPPAQDGYSLYYQWQKQQPSLPRYAATSLNLRYAYSPRQLTDVQEIIDDSPRALNLLHQAAGKPYVITSPADVPTLKLRRDAARTLRTEAFLLAHKGSYARAISVDALGLNIAKQGSLSSTIIGFFDSRAIEEISLSGVQDIMTMAGPNKAVDEQVEATLRKTLPVVSLKSSLKGDIPLFITEFDSIRPRSDQSDPAEQRFVSSVYDAAEARYLANQIVLVGAADLPSARRRATYSSVDAPNDFKHKHDPVSLALDNITIWNSASLDVEDNEVKSREQVTLAAAAILETKAKTGRFPAALPGVFPDPFTGKPLGYTVNDQTGFVVYSVGRTGLYNGKTPNNNEASYRYPAPAPVPSPW